MKSFEDIATNDLINQEYRKSFLLNIFRKICVKMKKDDKYKKHIKKLYLESTNKQITTILIVKDIFDYNLSDSDACLLETWLSANLRKDNKRHTISSEVKNELYKKQKGRCAVCGEPLDTYSHVDHIIPWSLVGDELSNNYQYLCESCNESKSASIDYIFKSLIGLV